MCVDRCRPQRRVATTTIILFVHNNYMAHTFTCGDVTMLYLLYVQATSNYSILGSCEQCCFMCIESVTTFRCFPTGQLYRVCHQRVHNSLSHIWWCCTWVMWTPWLCHFVCIPSMALCLVLLCVSVSAIAHQCHVNLLHTLTVYLLASYYNNVHSAQLHVTAGYCGGGPEQGTC